MPTLTPPPDSQTPMPQIRDLARHVGETVTVRGWIATTRSSGKIAFLVLRDGSGLLQGVVSKKEVSEAVWERFGTLAQETSVAVTGSVKAEPRSPGGYEMQVADLEVLGASVDFPIQPKEHGTQYLFEHRHLWLRSRRQVAIAKVRATVVKAIRDFFDSNGFILTDTPILTGSIGEDAGDLFATDYFDLGKAYLAQTGQLYVEATAAALGKVYCFGPTFRAENSHTSRHAAEFWMIEPEVAFCDLAGDMALAEEFVKYLIRDAREHCAADLEFFSKFVDKELLARLDFVLERPFQRCSYTEAVAILNQSGKTWEHPVAWGDNLQSEHERFLTEEHFKCPVTVYNYPRAIKAFYMRVNDGDAPDRQTVAAMDLLVPGIGEIIGGSQREERLDLLKAGMALHHLSEKDYWWYLDLRRYGSVPHSGFGMGIERVVAWLCGLDHVRETIPFARTLNRIFP